MWQKFKENVALLKMCGEDLQVPYLLLCRSRFGQTELQLRAVCRGDGGSAAKRKLNSLRQKNAKESKYSITMQN